MEVLIKKLSHNPIEIKKVQEFLFKQIKIEFKYDYVPEWHRDIVKIDSFYINPKNNDFFIALNKNTEEIIATIGIRAYDKDFNEFKDMYSKEKTASIWRLFVDKKYRRCGLASKMFSVAENFANEQNYENIYLHTHRTLNGALEFWTKMGFIITFDTNNELETVHMDKNIQSIDITPIQSIFNYAMEF